MISEFQSYNDPTQLEASVLGTIISNNHLLEDTTLKTDYFVIESHKQLFEAFKWLKANNKPIDISTLLMNKSNIAMNANELMFLANSGNERKFENYVQILFENYQERQKIQILREALEENYSVEQVMKSLQSIESDQVDDYCNIKDLLLEVVEEPFQKPEKKSSYKTGLKMLDSVTGGLKDSELTFIAARPSMGKTALALNMMARLTEVNENVVPVFFTIEMGRKLIRNRLIAFFGNYNSRKLDNPYEKFTEEEKNKWIDVLDVTKRTNVELFDSGFQKVSDIRRKTRRMVRKHKGKKVVIFVDYLQLISPENSKMSEYERINDVSSGLKQLAKEFDIPVVCLSQLSRSNEKRTGDEKRPLMSDLRGSGSIEQDADVIMLLHRNDYYEQVAANHDNILEINVAKNRNGKTGCVETYFDRSTQTIIDK